MNKLVKALSLLILPFTLVSCSSKLTNFEDKDKWGPLNEEQVVTFKKDCASLFGTDEDINGVIINEYFGTFDDMSFYFVSSSIHKDGIDKFSNRSEVRKKGRMSLCLGIIFILLGTSQ